MVTRFQTVVITSAVLLFLWLSYGIWFIVWCCSSIIRCPHCCDTSRICCCRFCFEPDTEIPKIPYIIFTKTFYIIISVLILFVLSFSVLYLACCSSLSCVFSAVVSVSIYLMPTSLVRPSLSSWSTIQNQLTRSTDLISPSLIPFIYFMRSHCFFLFPMLLSSRCSV